jgi:hypothetical protein
VTESLYFSQEVSMSFPLQPQCPNPRHSGPPGPGECSRLLGSLLNQGKGSGHSGQTEPYLRPNYLPREEIARRAQAQQEAHGIFISPKQELEPQVSPPSLQSRPTSAEQKEQTQAAGILEHLWQAASSFFDALHQVPGTQAAVQTQPETPAAAPAKEAAAPISSERQERRDALALLKSHGQLNAGQARQVFTTYEKAGLPFNAKTISPYHDCHRVGAAKILVSSGSKLILKADYMIDGQQVTRAIKIKGCYTEQVLPSYFYGLNKPFPGGRDCELKCVAASAINQALGWNVVPKSWLGTHTMPDGTTRPALIMEYLPGEETSTNYPDDPQFWNGIGRIGLITELTRETDNAYPITVQNKPYFADFEFAFENSGEPASSFIKARQPIAHKTLDEFKAILVPGKLRTVLDGLLSETAIRYQEQRALAMQDTCAKPISQGGMR